MYITYKICKSMFVPLSWDVSLREFLMVSLIGFSYCLISLSAWSL